MIERHFAELGSLVEALERAGKAPRAADTAKISQNLAKLFAVDPDEVAVLALSDKNKSLKFLFPEKLAAVGTIPLTSTSALAAKSARERRAEVINNFSSTRHATVFEGVPMGRASDELIQKIMSAPILQGSRVVGVVQISRKGRTVADAGPDFTQKDLRTLTSLIPLLDRFVRLFEIS
jgi:GAF domain